MRRSFGICAGAFDEGTRALDNGALGVIVPHVNTGQDARRIVEAFRYPPLGHRSTGGIPAQFGYRPPPPLEMKETLNKELFLVAIIESPQAVENADEIAAVEGIDALIIGTSDLLMEMDLTGQIGHERVAAAYQRVGDAWRRHNKAMGMGGVYDQEYATRYIGMGARFNIVGSDVALFLDAATKRANFLRGLLPEPKS